MKKIFGIVITVVSLAFFTSEGMNQIKHTNNTERRIVPYQMELNARLNVLATCGLLGRITYTDRTIQFFDLNTPPWTCEGVLTEAALYADTSIEEVVLPGNIKMIGSNVFSNCLNLKRVYIPRSTVEISKTAMGDHSIFANCTLEQITLPKHLLYEYDANEDPAYYKKDIFKEEPLHVIVLPDNDPLHRIFSANKSDPDKCKLRSIVIPQDTRIISIDAFSNLLNIVTIQIPSSVQSIEPYAFNYCTNLKSVTFCTNSRLKKIGTSAFSMTDIDCIVIPKSVVAIGDYAFYRCKNLKTLKFEEKSIIEEINTSAFMSTSIEQAKIPSSITLIGISAFSYCPNLREISFEPGTEIETIDKYTFSYSGIRVITIPPSITSIGSDAFFGSEITNAELLGDEIELLLAFVACDNLNLISFPNAKTIKISEGVFDRHNDKLSIFTIPNAEIEEVQ